MKSMPSQKIIGILHNPPLQSINYGKSKVSGSLSPSYILHSRGACMPGQSSIFTPNYKKKLRAYSLEIEQRKIKSFVLHNLLSINTPISFWSGKIEDFSFQRQFQPHDDESLIFAIRASYRQIYGNFHAFESEKPIDLERRLRNGDITIKEFIRNLAKSNFYKHHYFENVNQIRCVELSFKHVLGRTTINQNELIKHVGIIANDGFDFHIDTLIDSLEYMENFGDHTVPFIRFVNTQIGMRTSLFLNTMNIIGAGAVSDNLKKK